jgi:hypothetical protein
MATYTDCTCARGGNAATCEHHERPSLAKAARCEATDHATSGRRACVRRCTQKPGHPGEHTMSNWTLAAVQE